MLAIVVVIVGSAMCLSAQVPYQWDLPPDVNPPDLPEGFLMTGELVELGRHIFYDARLSGNGTQACASCHVQELAFTDGRALGLGSTGQLHPRSPMSLVNVAFRDALTWANRDLRLLEEQALAPMFGESPVELGLAGHETRIYAELSADPRYQELFNAAYPEWDSTVNRENVIRALAAFERSIVSFNSPYDRFRFLDDESALDDSAQRGMELFFSDRTNCGSCHLGQNMALNLGLNLDGASRTQYSFEAEPHFFLFHNTGLYDLGEPFSYPADNLGLYEHTEDLDDVGRFRPPTLRNIAVTAPYMHDGSIATLGEVLDHYAAGARAPNRLSSKVILSLELSEIDRADLIAFLESLTDPVVLNDSRWGNPWDRD
jgi:cytochrome c peroxidase